MKSKTILRPLAFLGGLFLVASSLFWLKISVETRAAATVAAPVFAPKSVGLVLEWALK